MKNSNSNPVLPALSEVEKIRYMTGQPRNWAFDASRGVFKFPDGGDITKPGESIIMVPIAYAVTEGTMFGLTRKDGSPDVRLWCQLFFIAQNGAVSCLLFHGFSVDSLNKFRSQHLFYDDLELTDVFLKVTPIKIETASGNVIWKLVFSSEGRIDFDPAPPSGIFAADYQGNGERLIDSVNYAHPALPGPKKE